MLDAFLKGFSGQFAAKAIGALAAVWLVLVLMHWLRASPEEAAGRLTQTVQPPVSLAA